MIKNKFDETQEIKFAPVIFYWIYLMQFSIIFFGISVWLSLRFWFDFQFASSLHDFVNISNFSFLDFEWKCLRCLSSSDFIHPPIYPFFMCNSFAYFLFWSQLENIRNPIKFTISLLFLSHQTNSCQMSPCQSCLIWFLELISLLKVNAIEAANNYIISILSI